MDRYGPREASNATRMLALAEAAGVPAVLTNAVRFLDPADHRIGHVLDSARHLLPLHSRHLERSTSHAYLKTGAEMALVARRICGGDAERMARLFAVTRRIARRCVLDPVEILALRADPPRLHLPEVGGDPVGLLRRRCADGLRERGLERSKQARRRLAEELDVIERKGLSGYFVAVAGITDMIRGMGVRCAIRGSGAGSLVTYLLRIGEVNPLEHGLLMERFLAESRVGLPDIDIDVESARRLDCYRAIRDRYGEARVACVSMMETYRARSAIRDVGMALGLPPHEVDVIAKAFPHVRARQIRAALSDLPELRQSGLNDRLLETAFRLAERLDGLPRHIALHPCGVLVGNAGLRDRTPVERSLLGFPMSQFDKDDVEEAGLLKLDVLGVRMQSALAYAVAEIERVDGERVDLDAIPHDDAATYEMIREARTIGCFQIESPGQRELVAKLEPRTLHDLIVDISLFRPGPVNSDMVTPYLETRHGWRPPRYPHPSLRPVLEETGGVVVFHEQVLRIIDVMTGKGLSEAERVRRGLSDPESRARMREWFFANLRPEYTREEAEEAWRVLDAFGAFGFCKAHAAAFALPTYQSAWLKRHHTAAFLAGVLTHEPGMYPPRVILDEARRCGVAVLPLDVNRSDRTWRVERVPPAAGYGAAPPVGRPPLSRPGYGLRVPLSAVKGISEAEIDRILAGRPYTSLADFWERARPSRPVAERIVEVGGFDALHGLRPRRAPLAARTPHPAGPDRPGGGAGAGLVGGGGEPARDGLHRAGAARRAAGDDRGRGGRGRAGDPRPRREPPRDRLLRRAARRARRDPGPRPAALPQRRGDPGGGGEGGHPDARGPVRAAGHLHHPGGLHRAGRPDVLRVGAGPLRGHRVRLLAARGARGGAAHRRPGGVGARDRLLEPRRPRPGPARGRHGRGAGAHARLPPGRVRRGRRHLDRVPQRLPALPVRRRRPRARPDPAAAPHVARQRGQLRPHGPAGRREVIVTPEIPESLPLTGTYQM